LVNQRGDLLVIELENIAQQKHRALGGSEALEHHQERHRNLIEQLHAADTSFLEIDRLGEPIAAAFFVARFRRIELVEAQARDELDQISARRGYVYTAAAPAQPSFLHHIFSAPEIAEHAVSMRHEQGPMRFKGREIVSGGTRRQNGFTSISNVITATSVHIPYAIHSTRRRAPERMARRAKPCSAPVATRRRADPRNHQDS